MRRVCRHPLSAQTIGINNTDRKTNKWRAAQTGKRENSFRTASSGSLSILYRGIGRWKDMSESDNQYEARYFDRGFGILFLNNGI